MPLQALFDHAEHELVGYEVAPIHILLGFAAEVRLIRHRFAQQIAGRDVRDAETFAQNVTLRTFARTGGPQQRDSHGDHLRPRTLAFFMKPS